MKPTSFRSSVALSPLNNANKSRGRYDAARRNALATPPAGLLGFTETWPAEVKAAICDVFEHTHTIYSTPGQSVTIGWAWDEWEVLETWSIKLHGRIPGISDARYAMCARLRHRVTGQVVILVGVHLAPIRPQVGRWAVLAGNAAHAQARRRLRKLYDYRTAPVIVLGDFNEAHLNPGRTSRVAAGEPIIHAEIHQGTHARVTVDEAAPYPLPRSDHRGLVVDYTLRVVRP